MAAGRAVVLLAVCARARDFTFSGELMDDQFPGGNNRSQISGPLKHDFTKSEMPGSWDWGDIGGQSYLTPVKNQNEPQYCGSCWAHATLTSLADRIKIASAAQGEFPDADVTLSVQAVLNCGKHYAGTCAYGRMGGVYHWIMNVDGIPYESCQNYMARDIRDDDSDGRCSQTLMCKMCAATYSYAYHDDDDLIAEEEAAAAAATKAAISAAVSRPAPSLRGGSICCTAAARWARTAESRDGAALFVGSICGSNVC